MITAIAVGIVPPGWVFGLFVMWRIKFNRGRARLLEPGDLCVVHGGSWLDVAEDGSRWSTEYRLLDPRSKFKEDNSILTLPSDVAQAWLPEESTEAGGPLL